MKIKDLIITSVIFAIGIFLLVYNLHMIPPGIDTDEGAIAYNALLISQDLKDQNNRFLPFFILSADGYDWKQPVLVYTSAIVFRIFGASYITFKLVNVAFAVVGGIFLYLLLKKLFDLKLGLLGILIYFSTPAVIITARIGNESIDPVLFSAVWLYALYMYQKTNRGLYIILTALSLGIGFYSFKGMRLVVPVWIMLSAFFIFFQQIKGSETFRRFCQLKLKDKLLLKKLITIFKDIVVDKKVLHPLLIYVLILLPFFAIVPYLEKSYAGAVFDRKGLNIDTHQHYLYYWFYNLSIPSFFFKGDIGKIYEMPLLGFWSLGVLPGFMVGIFEAIKKRSFFGFILISYLLTPILFGFAGSLDYPHRLMAMGPLYVVLTVLGYQKIIKYTHKSSVYFVDNLLKKSLIVFLVVFFMINFAGFTSYYYFEYPRLHSTKQAFHNDLHIPFYTLAKISDENGIVPYVQEDIYTKYEEGNKFFELSYFDNSINIWRLGEEMPTNSALLTQNSQLDNAQNTEIEIGPYHILIRF